MQIDTLRALMQWRSSQVYLHVSERDTRENLIDYYAKYIALFIEKEAYTNSEINLLVNFQYI